MALTLTRLSGGGGKRRMQSATADDIVCVFGTLTFDTAYATGGETLAPSSIGLQEVLFITFDEGCSAIGDMNYGCRASYDYTNNKVIALVSAGASGFAEAWDGANLSWLSVRFQAFGRK